MNILSDKIDNMEKLIIELVCYGNNFLFHYISFNIYYIIFRKNANYYFYFIFLYLFYIFFIITYFFEKMRIIFYIFYFIF